MEKKNIEVYNLSDIIHEGTQLAQANMFYRGDWAYVKKIGKKGLVKETHNGECEQLVTLLMEDGSILKVRSDECDFTTPDPKTAFLRDLSELLRKYDAEFADNENYEVIFNLGDKVSIFIDTTDVFNWTNADNLIERATSSDDK